VSRLFNIILRNPRDLSLTSSDAAARVDKEKISQKQQQTTRLTTNNKNNKQQQDKQQQDKQQR